MDDSASAPAPADAPVTPAPTGEAAPIDAPAPAEAAPVDTVETLRAAIDDLRLRVSALEPKPVVPPKVW